MALYTKDSVDRVKDAVDMVELVSARTDLRRVGMRYTGLCPFHEERTPSFSVSAENKLYHCFGCGVSGDAIRFVQDTEGLDFREAVELLADRYGVELRREQEDPRAEQRRRRRERLLALLERATAYYARYLWDSAEAEPARAHLSARGLERPILDEFRVGYAPSAWDAVCSAALRSGFTREEIEAAGIGQPGRRGGLIDRFRGRITFPLADPRGRVLGFGARATRDGQQPKYLNSSENELYHKGRQLFGIDRARAAAARAGRVVVVEGYTDVLALHQAGIRESVAIMGTALTRDQLAELARAAGEVYLALDADRSGQEAMLRAAAMALERGVELRVVDMPEGHDPAELLAAEGADAFAGRLQRSLSVPEFQVRRVLATADLHSARGRDQALERLRPLVAMAPDRSVTRDELVRLAADRLDVPVDYLSVRPAPRSRRFQPGGPRGGEDHGGPAQPVAAPTAQRPGRPVPFDPIARGERSFLAMCLARGELGRDYLARLTDDHLTSAALRQVRDHLLEHFDDPMATASELDPALAARLNEVVMLADDERPSDEVLRLSFLQLDLRRIERDERRAAEAGDFERQRALWVPREEAKAQIDELMGLAQ